MQDTHDVNTEADQLFAHLAIAPEVEDGGGGRIKRHIGIASRLCRFTALVNRVIITDSEGQFANLAPFNLNGERRKAVAYLAFIEHVHTSCCLYIFCKNSI